jgi:hypothetical protein
MGQDEMVRALFGFDGLLTRKILPFSLNSWLNINLMAALGPVSGAGFADYPVVRLRSVLGSHRVAADSIGRRIL